MTADTQPREAASGSTTPGTETSHEAIARFVAETAALTQPDRVHWHMLAHRHYARRLVPEPGHLRNPATSLVTWPLPLLTGVSKEATAMAANPSATLNPTSSAAIRLRAGSPRRMTVMATARNSHCGIAT